MFIKSKHTPFTPVYILNKVVYANKKKKKQETSSWCGTVKMLHYFTIIFKWEHVEFPSKKKKVIKLHHSKHYVMSPVSDGIIPYNGRLSRIINRDIETR